MIWHRAAWHMGSKGTLHSPFPFTHSIQASQQRECNPHLTHTLQRHLAHPHTTHHTQPSLASQGSGSAPRLRSPLPPSSRLNAPSSTHSAPCRSFPLRHYGRAEPQRRRAVRYTRAAARAAPLRLRTACRASWASEGTLPSRPRSKLALHYSPSAWSRRAVRVLCSSRAWRSCRAPWLRRSVGRSRAPWPSRKRRCSW